MQDRTFYLHAGGPKAGSSALQVFLSLNAERLLDSGFAYKAFGVPVTDEQVVTAGNGVDLHSVLSSAHQSDAVWRANIRQAFMNHFTEGRPYAICSSEDFSLLSVRGWTALRQIADEEGVSLVVCYLVRNPIDFLRSSYDQALRHGAAFTWPHFLTLATDWLHHEALQRLITTLGKESLRVVSYDKCRKRIVESFLEILGASGHVAAGLVDGGNRRIVNRSMTSAEREILFVFNQSAGGRLSNMLSTALLRANQHATPQPNPVDEGDLRRLEEIFEPKVQWINDKFFGGQKIIPVTGLHADAEVDSEQVRKDELVAYKAAFEVLVQEVGKKRGEAIAEIFARLQAIDWVNSSDPAVPEDFDPIGYLLNNLDVMTAGVGPFRHYIDYGAREQRLWKPKHGG